MCNEVEEAREEFYLHAKHKEPTNALKRPTWARANVGHLRMQVTWSFLGEKEKKRWFAGVCCGVRIRNKNGEIIYLRTCNKMLITKMCVDEKQSLFCSCTCKIRPCFWSLLL